MNIKSNKEVNMSKMKRIFLSIIFILVLSIFCSSCQYKKDSSKLPSESINTDEKNPIQEARELMLD